MPLTKSQNLSPMASKGSKPSLTQIQAVKIWLRRLTRTLVLKQKSLRLQMWVKWSTNVTKTMKQRDCLSSREAELLFLITNQLSAVSREMGSLELMQQTQIKVWLELTMKTEFQSFWILWSQKIGKTRLGPNAHFSECMMAMEVMPVQNSWEITCITMW